MSRSTLLICPAQKFRYTKKGYQQKSRKLFVSQYRSTKKLVGKAFWYFSKIPVFLKVTCAVNLSGAKFSWTIQGLSQKGVENFLFSKNISSWGPFGVSERFWYQRTMRNGDITFAIETFLSCSTKNIRRRTFPSSQNFGYLKTLCIRGRYHDFPLEIFCLKLPKKFSRGTLPCFWSFLVSKKFLHKRGYADFPSIFFASHYRSFWPKRPSGVCKYLLMFVIDCTCMLYNVMPCKTKRKKIRKTIVLLKLGIYYY